MKSDQRVFGRAYMADVGADPNRPNNWHRIFRHTARNEARLRDIVKRRALREYLKLVGL